MTTMKELIAEFEAQPRLSQEEIIRAAYSIDNTSPPPPPPPPPPPSSRPTTAATPTRPTAATTSRPVICVVGRISRNQKH